MTSSELAESRAQKASQPPTTGTQCDELKLETKLKSHWSFSSNICKWSIFKSSPTQLPSAERQNYEREDREERVILNHGLTDLPKSSPLVHFVAIVKLLLHFLR